MDELERKIRFVANMFRVVAWPLAVLLVPAAVYFFVIFFSAAFADAGSILPLVICLPFVAAIGYLPVYMLRVAKRIDRGDFTALGPANAITGFLSLTGFPITTIVGIFLINRMGQYYEPYCRERELSASTQ